MKLFEELTQLHGVSGYETAVADYIKEKLAPATLPHHSDISA